MNDDCASGEIAGVVADECYVGHEALDRIDMTYDRLNAVVGPSAAIEAGTPTVHEEAPGNVAFEWSVGNEAATNRTFKTAAHTVGVDLVNNRVIPTTMEPRAVVARYRRSDDALVVELSAQNPHVVQRDLSSVLDVSTHRITVRMPDVGGGFGAKLQPHTGYVLAAWCAMQLDRPIKWQATRTEDFLSMVHS